MAEVCLQDASWKSEEPLTHQPPRTIDSANVDGAKVYDHDRAMTEWFDSMMENLVKARARGETMYQGESIDALMAMLFEFEGSEL
jgi:hypothetical protein